MRRILFMLVAALLAVTTVACTGEEGGPSTRTAANGDEVNAADVEFVSNLLRHDAEGLLLIDHTMDRELDPELDGIVEEIRDELLLEVEDLAGQLDAWGEEVPETVRDHANSHGHDEDREHHPYDDLASVEPAEFQRIWVGEMVGHLQGTIVLAEAASEEGHQVTDRAAEVATARETLLERLSDLPIG